jgi:hypothetical protein
MLIKVLKRVLILLGTAGMRMANTRPSRETSVNERKHAPATTTIIQLKGGKEPNMRPRLQRC